MALRWQTILIDRSSGSPVEVNATGIHTYPTSQFQSAGQDNPATGLLDLDFLFLESWTLQQGMEWWAGFRDDSSGIWALEDAAGRPALVYGGYVTTQTGTALGPRHRIAQTLSVYDYDLTTTDLEIWPSVPDYPAVYPDGYSAADWLIGTVAGGKPYDGLIPARLGSSGGYLLDGVDPAFDSIIFNEVGVKPGVAVKHFPVNGGIWALVDLKAAIDDVIAGIRLVNPAMDPAAFVEAAIDPSDATRIRPRFRLTDRADTTGTPVAILASDADVSGGEWPIMEPFKHIITQPGSQQRVIVWGPTTADGTLSGPPLYAVAYDASRPVQPTVYQTDPGRSGKPYYSDDIATLAQAQAYADQVENQAWAPLRTLQLRTMRATLPGELVHIRVPQEGINEAFRVVQVTTAPGPMRYYDLTIGTPAPDYSSLIQQRAARQHALQQLAALGIRFPGGQTGAPGAARRVPVHSTPQNPTSMENRIMPGFNDTVGLTIQGNAQDRDPSVPVLPASYAAGLVVKGAATETTPDPKPGLWANDEAHPYTVDFGYLPAAGTYKTHLDYAMSMRRLSIKGTGTVTLQREGSDVAGPYSVSGSWKNLLISVDFVPGEDLGVVISGTSGAGVSVKVKEREDPVVP